MTQLAWPRSVWIGRPVAASQIRAVPSRLAVASRLPTYWLDLGQDLAEIPLRVGEILAEVASTDPGVATRGGERR